MDVYRQAAAFIRKVREGKGTAKSLCLSKTVQKKKQTYAVVCETLKNEPLLKAVLDESKFFTDYPNLVNKMDLILVLTYDTVLGLGVKTRQSREAQAIHAKTIQLKGALTQVNKSNRGNSLYVDPAILGRLDVDHSTTINRERNESNLPNLIPRYARINTLLVNNVPKLRRKLQMTYTNAKNAYEENNTHDQTALQRNNNGGKRLRFDNDDKDDVNLLPPLDEHIPDLLVFPPRTPLYKHALVRSHHLVLQDKASCLPAVILCGKVELSSQHVSLSKWKQPSCVLDACAAPGNKTTHLAGLLPQSSKVIACDIDVKRHELLMSNIKQCGADERVDCFRVDFLDICSPSVNKDEEEKGGEGEGKSQPRRRQQSKGKTHLIQKLSQRASKEVDAILLDPSCSASGMIFRLDRQLALQHSPEQKELEKKRVGRLAAMQTKMLIHALSNFPRVRRVVYSTCSVNVEENEHVVAQALKSVAKFGWSLTHIMPSKWPRSDETTLVDCEAHGNDGNDIRYISSAAIHCVPSEHLSNGFFVVCFDRRL